MSETTTEELLNDLEALQVIAEMPGLFLANYFINLRNQVDKEIVSKQIKLNNNFDKLAKLNELWEKMISKIDLFEKNCPRKRFNLEAHKQSINAIRLKLKEQAHVNLSDVKEAINNEEQSLLRTLFQNKTIFFIRGETERELSNGQLVISNDVFISPNSMITAKR